MSKKRIYVRHTLDGGGRYYIDVAEIEGSVLEQIWGVLARQIAGEILGDTVPAEPTRDRPTPEQMRAAAEAAANDPDYDSDLWGHEAHRKWLEQFLKDVRELADAVQGCMNDELRYSCRQCGDPDCKGGLPTILAKVEAYLGDDKPVEGKPDLRGAVDWLMGEYHKRNIRCYSFNAMEAIIAVDEALEATECE